MNFDDVFMVEGFQYFCFNKDAVDITHRTDVLRLYDLYCVFLPCLPVFGQVDISKTTLSKFICHFVLSETVARIEILPSRGIQNCFILYVFNIVIEILCAIGIE